MWSFFDDTVFKVCLMNTNELDKRLSTHEAVCSERWLEILSRVRRLEMILIGSFGSIIIILITIILKLQ